MGKPAKLQKPGIPIPLVPLKNDPLVSVLIANFNYEQFIRVAIESVLGQSYERLEIVICDDGSKDKSLRIIRSFNDPRIYIIEKSNGGQASAINAAYAASSGAIVCILDADDAFEPKKICEVVDAFKNDSNTGFVIHDLKLIDEHGRTTGLARFKLSGYLGSEIPTLRMGFPIPQSSGLSFRREVLEKIIPLPEDTFRSNADWAIGYLACIITKTTLIPKPLAQYRIHSSSLSGTTKTAKRIELVSIGKTLNGIEKVVNYVNMRAQKHWDISIQTNHTRNYVEHRLILSILSEDSAQRQTSIADLVSAFKSARRDYPTLRYYYWRLLAVVPIRLSRYFLISSFYLYRLLRKNALIS